jgi:hypothetical protein
MRTLPGKRWDRLKNLSAVQYQSLKAAGQLQLLESPRWVTAKGDVEFTFIEPTQGVSLLDLTW